MTPSLAARGLLAAYAARHPGSSPPLVGLAMALAYAIAAEGALSRYYLGTNNYGSVHATKSWAAAHAEAPGYGMVAFLDHQSGLPGTGASGAYVARMRVYPSPMDGASDYLSIVEAMVPLASVQSASDFAAGLYAHGYYAGFSPHAGTSEPPRTPVGDRPSALAGGTLNASDLANIADGAAAVSRGLAQAQAAFAAAASDPADPSATTVGPPFAPLADRLTPAPSYAPHTLEHAAELLGPAASSPPPGAVSLDDALAAPGGDGVWLFASAAPPSPDRGGFVVVARSTDRARLVFAGLLGAVAGVGAGVAGALIAHEVKR